MHQPQQPEDDEDCFALIAEERGNVHFASISPAMEEADPF
jgi:hypothetical protein